MTTYVYVKPTGEFGFVVRRDADKAAVETRGGSECGVCWWPSADLVEISRGDYVNRRAP